MSLPYVFLEPFQETRAQAPAWECCFFAGNLAAATQLFRRFAQTVDHLDPIVIDATLTLPKLIDLTHGKNIRIRPGLTPLEEEAAAIAERSKSWTAGASQASIGYQSIAPVSG